MEKVEEFTRIESVFVRHRNALLLRGDFTPLFTDYYLHAMQFGLKLDPALAGKLKDLLALFTLHLVSRPWAEQYAWTVSLKKLKANLFVSGSSVSESVVGRYFTENVRKTDRNMLFSQLLREGKEPGMSAVSLHSADPVKWMEDFYRQSEQRHARAFDLGNDRYALVCAQPDCDEPWLKGLTAGAVNRIDEVEEVKVLETRKFKFECGCTIEKILPVLKGWKGKLDELFGDDDKIEITCPRCNAKYEVTRSQVEGIA